MNTMTVRVARALAMHAGGAMVGPGQNAATREFAWKADGEHFEQYVEAHWFQHMYAATFAIEALREPTLEQRTFLEGKVGVEWIKGWHAMIDAMLAPYIEEAP